MGVRRILVLGIVAAVACTGRPRRPVLVGTLERDRIEVVAEAFEPIVEIAVREGDHVTAGDVLLRLDDARGRAEVAQADAARAQAEARLAELVRGPRPELVDEARARLAAAESALAGEEAEFQRIAPLAASRIASRQQLDLARARRDGARAARDEAASALARLRDGTTAEELAQARAAVAQAEAALAVAQLRLERLVVRAPRDGYVDALPFHAGERLPAGTVVGVMVAEGAPYARVFVPETARARVGPGTAARVSVDGVPRAFAGRVRSVAIDAAFTPHYALTERDRGRLSYEAKVDLLDPGAAGLPTGVPVEVTLDLAADVA